MNAHRSDLPRSSRIVRAACSVAAALMTVALLGSQFGLAAHYTASDAEELASRPSAELAKAPRTTRHRA